jgi:uncharacterized short protein YbdD (DUF466 family)
MGGVTSMRAVWSWFRAVFGDSAYESYARHARAHGATPLSREAFYLDTLGRRYSTTSRCC